MALTGCPRCRNKKYHMGEKCSQCGYVNMFADGVSFESLSLMHESEMMEHVMRGYEEEMKKKEEEKKLQIEPTAWEKFNNWEWSGCVWLILVGLLFSWITGEFKNGNSDNDTRSSAPGYESYDPVFGGEMVVGRDEFDAGRDYDPSDAYRDAYKDEFKRQTDMDTADAIASYYESLETETLTACVNVFRLNVRMGPGTNYGARKSIPEGTCVELIGRNKAADWVQQEDGWMYARMTDIEGNVYSLPVTEDSQSSQPYTQQPSSYSCNCSGNQYNCSSFSIWIEAQACYEYCISLGRGDIHWLDDDNDGVACESLR